MLTWREDTKLSGQSSTLSPDSAKIHGKGRR